LLTYTFEEFVQIPQGQWFTTCVHNGKPVICSQQEGKEDRYFKVDGNKLIKFDISSIQ